MKKIATILCLTFLASCSIKDSAEQKRAESWKKSWEEKCEENHKLRDSILVLEVRIIAHQTFEKDSVY